MNNTFHTCTELVVEGKKFSFHSLPKLAEQGFAGVSRLPFAHKVLLENLLRWEDGTTVTRADIEALAKWDPQAKPNREIQFRPTRTLLQDFTGVPAIADLAAMRAAIKRLGGNPDCVNPGQPADLVIDHSVQVDAFGTPGAFEKNVEMEFARNQERYQFLRWGQTAFRNFQVVPPGTGIVHQVNLEFLSRVAMTEQKKGTTWVFPDTLVGMDSHTTMINGLGILAWGVGGIEAEAAMLGQPISMLIPEVVGFKLTGHLPTGTTATDLVLTVTHCLREKGVVGKFVEFFGHGLKYLTLADRATISNMAPEYGATIGIFPVDERTTEYLNLTGRQHLVPLVEAYFRCQGMWYRDDQPASYSDQLELDLGTVAPCIAGPSRPQDRMELKDAKATFATTLPQLMLPGATTETERTDVLHHGAVVIAAITSCTNTSNPHGLMAAGLLARNAARKGLRPKSWVKTSLAPGSRVVTDYLRDAGLLSDLEALGFNLVGYGCTTCIGNSGPLPEAIAKIVQDKKLVVASVLSGNRNFEGRINPLVRANFLASPALVVAYALAGTVTVDLTREPLGKGSDGTPVTLKDIWPPQEEVGEFVSRYVHGKLFQQGYRDVFEGDARWKQLPTPQGSMYQWDPDSTYIKEPPFFADVEREPKPIEDICGARVLLVLKHSITTDHISPAGSIAVESPAGQYLIAHGVMPKDFNAYGTRRGNHEVMVRGTFANGRIKNKLVAGKEGGFTTHFPDGQQMTVFDAAMLYQKENTPLIVIAGKEYGSGSSRDWAAKGPKLLGVRAVLAESFERIHRSNLVGMGILPLQFEEGQDAESLGLTGGECYDVAGLSTLTTRQHISIQVTAPDGIQRTITAIVRIDTPNELDYFRHGGILPYVLRQALTSKAA